MAGLSLLEPLQGVGNAACSQPHTALSFAHGLSSAQVFLWAQSLPPTAGLGSLPFRLASRPLACCVVSSFSCASDALLFAHSLPLGTTPWVPFSPHPLWPGPRALALKQLLFPALAPWTPWKVQARLLFVPTDRRAAKNGEESKAAQHPGVAHVPQPGEGWAGRSPQGHSAVRSCSLETLGLQPQQHRAAGTDGWGHCLSVTFLPLELTLSRFFLGGTSRNGSRHPFLLNIFPDGYTPRSSSSQEKEKKEKKLLDCCFEGGNGALAKVFPLGL